MNVQDAKNLTITEGNVKTIHDKDNQLLWGAVGYDTKYAGDTSQNGIPTPDSPIPVNVVTGVQTVTVDGGGSNSQTYTIDLGSIELCKIGDYQDYIYKSGDDWYVHKEVGKLTLSGSVDESWGVGNSTGSPDCLYCTSAILDSLSLSTGGIQIWAKCSHFTNAGKGLTSGITDNISEFTIGTSTSRLRILVRKEIATNKATWDSWLSTNNPIIYYSLATPTDTKITDQTLIGQLESVNQWATRYGYTESVQGNLPIILSKATI